MRYLISYDLDKPGQNYDKVIAALTAVGATRVLFSQWIVRWNNTTAASIRSYVWANMDSNVFFASVHSSHTSCGATLSNGLIFP